MSYRRTLRELAFDSHGVVTLRDAEGAGVPAVEVRKLAARGALTRIGQGVYRMNEVPTDRLDEFAAAVALVGQDAVLIDDAVLAALGLAQVNLRSIRVASPGRVRRHLPSTVEVVNCSVPESDQEDIGGIPAMNLRSALLGSRGRIMAERLIEAAQQAAKRGLLSSEESARVIKELQSA